MNNEKYNELANKIMQDAKDNGLPWFAGIFNQELMKEIKKENAPENPISKWTLRPDMYAVCSSCKFCRDAYTQIGWKYCPNCGSKMEEV